MSYPFRYLCLCTSFFSLFAYPLHSAQQEEQKAAYDQPGESSGSNKQEGQAGHTQPSPIVQDKSPLTLITHKITKKGIKKEIDNQLDEDEEDEWQDNLADDVTTIVSKAANLEQNEEKNQEEIQSPLFLGIILKQGEKYYRYLLCNQVQIPNEAVRAAQRKKFHLVNTPPSHSVIILLQLLYHLQKKHHRDNNELAFEEKPQVHALAASSTICTRCAYLLSPILNFQGRLPGHDDHGCGKTPWPPLPQTAQAFLEECILRHPKPIAVMKQFVLHIDTDYATSQQQLGTLKDQITRLQQQARKDEDTITILSGEVERVKKEKDDLNQQIANKDNTIAELSQQITNKDRAMEELNQQITNKDNTIAELNQQTTNKDNTIAELNQQTTNKDNTIADLNQQLTTTRGNVATLTQKIETLQQRENMVKTTVSWAKGIVKELTASDFVQTWNNDPTLFVIIYKRLTPNIVGTVVERLSQLHNEQDEEKQPDGIVQRSRLPLKIRQHLWQILQSAQKDATLTVAAANSVSLLCYAGENWVGANLANAPLQGASFQGADLTRSTFAGANLKNVDFSNTIIAHTDFRQADLDGSKADHRQRFADKVKRHKIQGGDYYQEEIPKVLQSLANNYPQLTNAQKALALHIASGLAELPAWEDDDFWVKVQHWSLQLLALKKQTHGLQWVTLLEDSINDDVTYYCPQHGRNKKEVTPKVWDQEQPDFPAYLAHHKKVLQSYDVQKGNWDSNGGYGWYANNVTKEIESLQKVYPKVPDKTLKKEMISIACDLAEIHRFGSLAYLTRYMELQNRLLEITGSAGEWPKNELLYTVTRGGIHLLFGWRVVQK